MNFMTNANNEASEPQVVPGSATPGPGSQVPTGQPEETNGQGAQVVTPEVGADAKNYGELESKMGKMGVELGEYRSFFNNISPLLEKLDQNPELTQAILDGKIDNALAQSVLEGKVSVSDAQVVSEANKEVETEVGKKVLEAMSPEKIEKLIEGKAQEIRKEMEDKAELRDFEDKTQKFMEQTQDFAEHAEAIGKWLDTHDVTDVSVAYWAVKGELSEAVAKKAVEAAGGEQNRAMMENAPGGGTSAQHVPGQVSVIDELVGGSSNPLF